MSSRLVTGSPPLAPGNSTLSRLVSTSSRPWNVHVPFARASSSAASSSPVGGRVGMLRARRAAGCAPAALARPQPLGIGGDLVVGAAADHRARVILGIPPVDRVLVTLVQHEPVLLRRSARFVRTSDEAPAQLLAEQLDVQLAVRPPPRAGPCRRRAPTSPGPRRSRRRRRTRPGDHALEVDVLERVVLDVDGEVPLLGSSVSPFGTAQLTSTPSISRRKS